MKPGLTHASSTPIPVPSAKGLKSTENQPEGQEETPPVRSSSYTHISAPSPSSYGPRADWTVLDESEITEAEKVYEAERKARIQQAEMNTSTTEPTHNGSTATAKPKTGPLAGSTRSFGSGVAGLSKSFINIALGTSAGDSAATRSSVGKGNGKQTAMSATEAGPSTPARKQIYGRDAIRPDIDEILRGGPFCISLSRLSWLIDVLHQRPVAHSQGPHSIPRIGKWGGRGGLPLRTDSAFTPRGRYMLLFCHARHLASERLEQSEISQNRTTEREIRESPIRQSQGSRRVSGFW